MSSHTDREKNKNGELSEHQPAERPCIRISVRSLVEFILRSGDLDSRAGRGYDAEAMLAGGRVHRKIQKGMAGDYQSEMVLKDEIDFREYTLRIEGRADGVFTRDGSGAFGALEGDEPLVGVDEIKVASCARADRQAVSDKPLVVVDEIKGVYAEPEMMEEPVSVHLAQAKCYGAILLKNYLNEGWNDEPCRTDAIGVRMTYVNLEDDRRMKHFTERFGRDELFAWYDKVCAAYRKWIDWQVGWRRKRDASMEALTFPFPYRRGQKNLVSAVYHTISQGKELFLMAPTGVGKTMAVVYPSVRAVGQGIAGRIFYLTAKNQTLTVGAEAFRILADRGLKMKTILITSKEKICPMNEPSCNPDDCPYAKGHFDRINDAVFEFLEIEDSFSAESLRRQAEKWKVCPFELGLDTATWCDAVLCDYNYAFDPNVRLRRFFGEGVSGDYIFLIDEAHNMVDRAREMYSARLIKEDVLSAKKAVKSISPKTARALEKLNKELLAIRKDLEMAEEESPGKRDVCIKIGKPDEKFANALLRAYGALQEFFKEHKTFDDRDVRDFYFRFRDFMNTYEALNEDYVIYAFRDEEKHFHLKFFCVNPAGRLQEMVDKGRSAIFFSATLLPVGYYQKLLSRRDDNYAVYAESSYRDDQKIILIGKDVSTRYRSRNENMYRRIARYIHETVTVKRGNYMAFFPSYRFMQDVLDIYTREFDEDDVNYVAQSRYMSEMDREIFLENFYDDPAMTMIGFCVMGGVFAEGIDLTGSKLIGAVVAGCGLPQVTAETEILREYYDAREKRGFSYAYQIPGMNKVLQSAGRVIRTATDRGVIVLLDDRFLTGECQAMFPREWSSYVPCTADQVKGILKEFWERG